MLRLKPNASFYLIKILLSGFFGPNLDFLKGPGLFVSSRHFLSHLPRLLCICSLGRRNRLFPPWINFQAAAQGNFLQGLAMEKETSHFLSGDLGWPIFLETVGFTITSSSSNMWTQSLNRELHLEERLLRKERQSGESTACSPDTTECTDSPWL